MKTVKNDTRYIIKRIIIGVGIALILAFINNNKVFADSPQSFTWNGQSVPLNQENRSYFDFNNGLVFANNQLNNSLTTSQYIFRTGAIGFKNKNNDDYIAYEIKISSTSQNINNINYLGILKKTCNNNSICYSLGYLSSLNISDIDSNFVERNGYGVFISQDKTRRDNFYSSNSHYGQTRFTLNINGSTYYVCSFSIQGQGTFDFDYNDWNYLGGNSYLPNLNLNNLYYFDLINNDLEHTSPAEPNIPSGYSKIDLTGDEAVYFVPKNYNQVNIEHIDNVDYYDFNYYYTGSIKEGWFPLNNINDLFLDDYMSNNTSIDEVSYRDSFFPMYEDPNDTAQGYNYYAYIIFNNNQENSSIWYYSSQFDAYKITNIEEYNQNICFEDRRNEETCMDINFSSLISNYWIQGFNDDNSSFSGEQESSTNKLSNLFNFLKMPFTFLNSLKTYSCSTLSIPLPFINRNIQINCLSTTFKRVLGDNFYNIIIYIITGFYAYRITIMNIDTLTDVLDPNDDKLEVVDL